MSTSPNKVAIIGVPHDANSSYMKGPALAPARIREQMNSWSTNSTTERGVDLGELDCWHFAGDLDIENNAAGYEQITPGIRALLDQDQRVLTIGGDHAITWKLVAAQAEKYPDLTIIQFDAHPDLYDELDGNRNAHACPFARIMENGLAKRLIQIGIRTATRHQKEQAERFGVETVEAWRMDELDLSDIDGPVYISLDLDALDPAFAPGVSHHEPGGLSVRQILDVIQTLDADIVGADVVELNPHRDPVGMTAMVAAKFTKELLARMIFGRNQP